MAADVNQFIEDLKNAPNRSVILFHACAHNPTGADPSQEDWKKLADVCEEKQHFPIFDTAYQVKTPNNHGYFLLQIKVGKFYSVLLNSPILNA